MKKYILFFFLSFALSNMYSQKDSLQIGDRYSEDQLYTLVSYNQFFDQPSQVRGSEFSYGFAVGYIKDFILNKEGSFSIGLGAGYNIDSFNHAIRVTEINNVTTFEVDNTLTSNKLTIHNLEFPFEIRWRNSNANRYKFWRVYTGIKASYNLSNRFRYSDGTQSFSFENISQFNTLQFGLTMSVGYDAFTAHIYYGLTPILETASLGTADISTKIIRIGLIFYIL